MNMVPREDGPGEQVGPTAAGQQVRNPAGGTERITLFALVEALQALNVSALQALRAHILPTLYRSLPSESVAWVYHPSRRRW